MSVSLTPQQTLALWTLLGTSGQAPKKAVKPATDAAALLAAGLIAEGWTAEDAKTPRVEVTGKGWAWAGEHLADELPPKSHPLQAGSGA